MVSRGRGEAGLVKISVMAAKPKTRSEDTERGGNSFSYRNAAMKLTTMPMPPPSTTLWTKPFPVANHSRFPSRCLAEVRPVLPKARR